MKRIILIPLLFAMLGVARGQTVIQYTYVDGQVTQWIPVDVSLVKSAKITDSLPADMLTDELAMTDQATQQAEETQGVNVFPTPVTNNLTISVEGYKTGNYRLYDNQGHSLDNQPLSAGDNQVDMAGYTPGIYFMKVKVDDRVMTYKIVKR